MNKTIKLLCTWAAGLLLAGCSSEADMSKLMDWQSNPDAVHFTASVNNATTRTNPAATDDAQTKFNENDQVTVSIMVTRPTMPITERHGLLPLPTSICYGTDPT